MTNFVHFACKRKDHACLHCMHNLLQEHLLRQITTCMTAISYAHDCTVKVMPATKKIDIALEAVLNIEEYSGTNKKVNGGIRSGRQGTAECAYVHNTFIYVS